MRTVNSLIGSAIERREDLRFLRGAGEYVDDVAASGLLHAAILRSSVAHGQLKSIDVSAALDILGVQAVITAKDMPGGQPIIPMRLQPLSPGSTTWNQNGPSSGLVAIGPGEAIAVVNPAISVATESVP